MSVRLLGIVPPRHCTPLTLNNTLTFYPEASGGSHVRQIVTSDLTNGPGYGWLHMQKKGLPPPCPSDRRFYPECSSSAVAR